MHKVEIQLDREKIEREGKYDYAKMEAYIDRVCTSNGLHRELSAPESLVYVESKPELGFAEVACVCLDLEKQNTIIENCAKLIWWEQKRGTWYDENVLLKVRGY